MQSEQYPRFLSSRFMLASALLLSLAACATPSKETPAAQSEEQKAAAAVQSEPAPLSAKVQTPASPKTSSPPAKIDTLAQLADWEGKSPGISGSAGNLWDIPLFQRLFEKTVGKKYASEILRGWGGPAQSKIVRKDDSLIFHVSKKNDASNNDAYVFISLKSNTLGVCLHKTGPAKNSSRDLWMETGQKLKSLPADACAKYAELFRR